MAKQKCPECPPKGLPGYMGTMADMFTLLFAFFVLLFSMSTLDPAKMESTQDDAKKEKTAEEVKEIKEQLEKEKQALKSIGVDSLDNMSVEAYMDSIIQDTLEALAHKPSTRKMETSFASIKKILDIDSTAAELDRRDQRGLSMQINGDICFKSGKAEILDTLKYFLDAIADSFMVHRNDKRQIVIEGHTDNQRPGRKIREKYPSNWHLSSARASAVVEYLVNRGVNPARLSAHGYADRWPADMTWTDMRRGFVFQYDKENEREDRKNRMEMDDVIDSLNTSAELRRKNRRIKILVTHNNYVDGQGYGRMDYDTEGKQREFERKKKK